MSKVRLGGADVISTSDVEDADMNLPLLGFDHTAASADLKGVCRDSLIAV